MLKEKIIEIVSTSLNCDPDTLTDSSGLSIHENWDSLGHISIIVKLEKAFGITVDESNIFQLTTIEGIIRFLEGHNQNEE